MPIITFLLLFVISNVSAADYENYDEIVNKLSRYTSEELRESSPTGLEVRSFSRAHIGMGFSQTFFDADAPALNSSLQNQGGLLINVGVDLFSPRWGLEGSYSNFGTQNTSNSTIQLREFAIKGLYKPALNASWNMRLGLGMSSRFLDVENAQTAVNYRTPSGLFLFGIDSYINSFISVGADINFKTAMINDTIDRNSVDLAFRVDTHF